MSKQELQVSFLVGFVLSHLDLTGKLDTNHQECHPHNSQHGGVIEHALPKDYRWPNATVVYCFDGAFDKLELSAIHGAMELLMKVSCLRFEEKPCEERCLVITNSLGQGCWADAGRQDRGHTHMNLAKQCTRHQGTILHELMHVVGFLHQHTRPDRDRHLCVFYENILPHPVALYNYEIIRPWVELAFPLPYDFESIMHYTPEMYSVEPGRLPTMVPRHPWRVGSIGQRDQLTDYDMLGIQFLYCL